MTMRLEELVPIPLEPGDVLPEDVVIGSLSEQDVFEHVARHLGKNAWLVSEEACLFAQGCPWDRASLERRLDPGRQVVLDPSPHADDATIEAVMARVREASGLFVVGSGSLNDIAKMSAAKLGIPYVVFGTAASMNGYASGIAAIASRGVKTTVPARPPRAILLDPRVLGHAPKELGQAGLGDLLSKPVSMADWWLSHRLEGSTFSEGPGRIVDAAVREAADSAAGLPVRDPQAYASLAKALVLSGVSMVVAGSSSPASGGEHLISHYWDMVAMSQGRKLRLHGAQVGVATTVSAALYHRLITEDGPASVAPLPSVENERARVLREHGILGEAVWEAYEKKLAKREARGELLAKEWPRLRDELRAMSIPSPRQLRKVLADAGAPQTHSDMGFQDAELFDAVRLGRDIRDRVTVLDLAFELSLFPDHLTEIVQASLQG